MSVKPKSADKPSTKKLSGQNNLTCLADDILATIGVGIYLVQKGKFVYISPLHEELTGYSGAELLGTSPLDHVHPDDREIARENAIKNLKEGSLNTYECRFIKKNGDIMWLLEMVTSSVYGGKRATLGSFMNVTERKRTEAELRQSEQRYRTILENIQEGYYEVDLAGSFTFFNDAMCSLTGYSREELTGMNNRQYADEKTAKELYRLFNEVYRTGNPIKRLDHETLRKDGSKIFTEISVSLVRDSEGNPIGFQGLTRDITERKRTEAELRQSEQRYRTILENIQEGYFEVDLAGNFIFLNESECLFRGYTKEELIGKNYRQYADRENSKKVFQAFNKLYKTGEQIKELDYKIIKKDGTNAFTEISASLIRNAGGKPTGFRGITHAVTERRQMEEMIRQSEKRYRTILESTDEGYFEVNLTGDFTFVNDAECSNLGYSREELIGMNYRQYVDEATTNKLYRLFKKVYRTGEKVRGFESGYIRKDGTKGFNEISISLIRDSEGKQIGFRGLSRDVTERKLMEETIRQSEERYRTIIEEMEEWYFETDLTGNIIFANDVFANVLGRSQNELPGLNFRTFIKKEESESVYKLFHQVFETGKPTKNFPFEFVRPDGSIVIAELSIFPKRDRDGNFLGFRGVGHNITERKRTEQQLNYMATHDVLTGLPNRLMFSQLLSHAIESAKRYKKQLAVFFIDLDRFKIINDTLGHEAGDQLLQEIALRFKQSLRAADVVGRLGGDEFIILIEEVSDLNQVATVAHKILITAIKPMVLLGEECRVTASIGISIYPKDAEDEQSLMKNADIAMYLAKEEGKNNYQFYSKDIQSKSIERLSIETNLRFALERNELALHYQAKVDFKTNTITGVEALLRWQNPNLGSVTPTQFIPVAEESGLIIPIGRWVLKTACAQNVAWQRQGLPAVCMAVNLSLRQLADYNLLEDIGAALKDSGMAPNLLELEVTESMVMHNPLRMIAVLTKIKKMGVRLAIDDFGTGYSSLAQIKHFPVDMLKVDRSFIRNIPQDSEDKAITKAIIAMGKTLSLTVIAEGVETQEQKNFLREHDCDEMQGYYFSKPIMPDQFADLLRKHVPSPR